LYHERNMIIDWMKNGRSDADLLLDEEAIESDTLSQPELWWKVIIQEHYKE
jgi:hypothetical protein